MFVWGRLQFTGPGTGRAAQRRQMAADLMQPTTTSHIATSRWGQPGGCVHKRRACVFGSKSEIVDLLAQLRCARRRKKGGLSGGCRGAGREAAGAGESTQSGRQDGGTVENSTLRDRSHVRSIIERSNRLASSTGRGSQSTFNECPRVKAKKTDMQWNLDLLARAVRTAKKYGIPVVKIICSMREQVYMERAAKKWPEVEVRFFARC